MKKIMIGLMAVILLSVSAHAQEKRVIKSRHFTRKQHHGMMMKQLNLSMDQQKQAKDIRLDFRNKMQELNKNESITVREFRDNRAKLIKEQRSKMAAILTPEQKDKLSQLRAAARSKRAMHFANHLNRLKTTLALTNEQVDQLKANREAMQSKMRSIRENESLTREQKRDQLIALKTETKNQHDRIFTGEQLKKMEEMKKKRDEQPASK